MIGQIVSVHKAGHNFRYVVRVSLGGKNYQEYGIIDPNRYFLGAHVELSSDGRQIIESRGR